MSFNNFQQADFRESNYQAAEAHQKRLQNKLEEIVKFFEEEYGGELLYVARKVNCLPIKNFIKQVK